MKILNKKAQKEILLMLAANHIIAEDALRKVESDKMSVDAYIDAKSHLIENTVRIASRVTGIEGMDTVRKMIESRTKRYEKL